MRQKTLLLDLAQCEVFNHLPPMKAGVLIKAVMSYCTTGEVASWGEDADLKPIFMTFRATLEEKSKTQRANIMKRWHGNDTNDTMVRLVSDQESESESEGDGKKRSKRKEEEGKGKAKESTKEKSEKKKAPQFVPPTLTQVKEYVEEQGLKMEAEHFYDHFSSNGWKVSGKATMKDWQAAVRNWARNETRYNQQPQRTPHGTSVGERAYNMLHFANEGHPERWKEERKIMQELQKDL